MKKDVKISNKEKECQFAEGYSTIINSDKRNPIHLPKICTISESQIPN